MVSSMTIYSGEAENLGLYLGHGTGRDADMPKALEGIDWQAVRVSWDAGIPVNEIAASHGVLSQTIRARAHKQCWKPRQLSPERSIIDRAAQVAARTAVKRASKRIEARMQTTVDQCVDESVSIAQKLLRESSRRLSDVSDANISGVATAARAGVDIWRKSLGLDATGSAGMACAISFEFTTRSPDNGIAPALHGVAPALHQTVALTLDATTGELSPD